MLVFFWILRFAQNDTVVCTISVSKRAEARHLAADSTRLYGKAK